MRPKKTRFFNDDGIDAILPLAGPAAAMVILIVILVSGG